MLQGRIEVFKQMQQVMGHDDIVGAIGRVVCGHVDDFEGDIVKTSLCQFLSSDLDHTGG